MFDLLYVDAALQTKRERLNSVPALLDELAKVSRCMFNYDAAAVQHWALWSEVGDMHEDPNFWFWIYRVKG